MISKRDRVLFKFSSTVLWANYTSSTKKSKIWISTLISYLEFGRKRRILKLIKTPQTNLTWLIHWLTLSSLNDHIMLSLPTQNNILKKFTFFSNSFTLSLSLWPFHFSYEIILFSLGFNLKKSNSMQWFWAEISISDLENYRVFSLFSV